jgi:murein DD-endopeptidase MepM/ murein hydrolase activator NlpD
MDATSSSPGLGAGRRAIPQACAVLLLSLLITAAWGCAGAHRAPASAPATEASPAEPARTPAPEPPGQPSEPDEVFHRVEPGQTLWRIARAYDVSLEELVRVNGIDDATEIEIGQMLLVPGASEKLDIAPYPAPLPGQSGAVATGRAAVLNVTFVWPVSGEILSYYGEQRRTHRHKGLDIRGRDGQRVVAAQTGRVVYSGNTMRGYGKTVIIDHGDGVQSLYAHNSRLLVDVGDEVKRGETIAKVGRTGNATTEHCHFEIRKDRVPINPLPHLSGSEEGS